MTVAVAYIGDDPDGEEFRATLIGQRADSGDRSAHVTVPITSGMRIRAVDWGRNVLLDLGDRVHRFKRSAAVS